MIYFFPEKIVPDHFYTALDRYVDFSLDVLLPYRFELDGRMQWVHRMQEIIENNSEPRKDRSHIPPRPAVKWQDAAADDGDDSADEEEIDGNSRVAEKSAKKRAPAGGLKEPSTSKRKKQKVEPKKKLSKKAAKELEDKKHSRKLYKEAMLKAHRRFFYAIMTQCAERGQGLLVELARIGPGGDFGFCRYTWTQAERAAFFKYSHVPAAAFELPAATPIVAIFYYCRHRESWFAGPKIAPKHYERLNLTDARSLIFWDISGPDLVSSPQGSTNGRPLVAIVPSEDVQPTPAQKSHIEASIRKPSDTWENVCPSVSGMLNTGRFVAEYCLPRMPMDAGCDWSAIWRLLNEISAAPDQFEHPRGILRASKLHRQPLQSINQRLAEYWDAHKRDNNSDNNDNSSGEIGEDDTEDDSEG